MTVAPLGHPKQPLRHVESLWVNERADIIAAEFSLASRPSRVQEFEILLNEAYHALRCGGILIVPLPCGHHDDITLHADISTATMARWEPHIVQGALCLERAPHDVQIIPSQTKKAFVYNCYFDTGGGGERSTLDFAAALDELGYEVSLVSTRRNNATLDSLRSSFGVDERFNWAMRTFSSEKAMAQAVRDEQVDVFVNHTFSSYLPNPAPIGIYVVMFPLPTLPSNIQALLSYSTLCCISEFTEQYVKTFWYDKLKTEIIYPPISSAHQKGDVGTFSTKERIVLQIGRFNVEGHSKCQLEAIETFCQLRRDNILGAEWKLRVVGRVNSGLHNERYIERCRDAIQGADVELLTNASLAAIRDLYRRAACLWQFTGFGLDYGAAPQYCEHLGLVAMDCFSYGTVPIIYQRGGMVPLIRHGENGFTFGTVSELKEIMEVIANSFGRIEHRTWYEQSKASADRLSFTEYRDAIGASLWRIGRDTASLDSLPKSLYSSYTLQESPYERRANASA
jgi:glycosyltransferase involved in cell wall biosynthesis